MKKTVFSGSRPTSNHYHPRTRDISGVMGFLGNILMGMFSPLLDPLRCRFQGHDPEPFYKEGKFSIHTHRCARCYATLGMGRIKWHEFGPPPFLPSGLVSLDEWHTVSQPIKDDLRPYSKQEQEEYFSKKSKERIARIIINRNLPIQPVPKLQKGGLSHFKETSNPFKP